MKSQAPETRATRLHRVVDELRAQHGRPRAPPASDAFALVLWEKVGYLPPDDRRLAAFEMLRDRVGLTPHTILAADPDVLRTIAERRGPMEAAKRAQRMQDAALLVIDEFDGSLDSVLQRPFAEAKRALQRIYGIGEPGAEKILLLTRASRAAAGLERRANARARRLRRRSQELLDDVSNGSRCDGVGAGRRFRLAHRRAFAAAATRPGGVQDLGAALRELPAADALPALRAHRRADVTRM